MRATILGALLFCAVVSLNGCATGYVALNPNTYPPEGYSDRQTGEASWAISFVGNSTTSPDRTHRYALMRAAELAASGGYDWITVDSRDTRYVGQAPTAIAPPKMDGGTNGVEGIYVSSFGERPSSSSYGSAKGGSRGWCAPTSTQRPFTSLAVTAHRGKPGPDVKDVFEVKPLLAELAKIR